MFRFIGATVLIGTTMGMKGGAKPAGAEPASAEPQLYHKLMQYLSEDSKEGYAAYGNKAISDAYEDLAKVVREIGSSHLKDKLLERFAEGGCFQKFFSEENEGLRSSFLSGRILNTEERFLGGGGWGYRPIEFYRLKEQTPQNMKYKLGNALRTLDRAMLTYYRWWMLNIYRRGKDGKRVDYSIGRCLDGRYFEVMTAVVPRTVNDFVAPDTTKEYAFYEARVRNFDERYSEYILAFHNNDNDMDLRRPREEIRLFEDGRDIKMIAVEYLNKNGEWERYTKGDIEDIYKKYVAKRLMGTHLFGVEREIAGTKYRVEEPSKYGKVLKFDPVNRTYTLAFGSSTEECPERLVYGVDLVKKAGEELTKVLPENYKHVMSLHERCHDPKNGPNGCLRRDVLSSYRRYRHFYSDALSYDWEKPVVEKEQKFYQRVGTSDIKQKLEGHKIFSPAIKAAFDKFEQILWQDFKVWVACHYEHWPKNCNFDKDEMQELRDIKFGYVNPKQVAEEDEKNEEEKPKKEWTCEELVEAMETIMHPVVNASDIDILVSFDRRFQCMEKDEGAQQDEKMAEGASSKKGWKYNDSDVFKHVMAELAQIKATIRPSCSWVMKFYSKNTSKPIDYLQAVAINMYTKETGGTFKIMNYVLRQHNKFSKDLPGDKDGARAAWDKYYHLLIAALKSAPQEKINTYRGVSYGKPDDLYREHLKGEIVHHDFMSSSTDRCVSQGFAGQGTLLEFTSDQTGADIKTMSAFAGEDEVLISPLIKWRMTSQTPGKPTILSLKSCGLVKPDHLEAGPVKPLEINGLAKDAKIVYPKPGEDVKVLSKVYGVNPASNELLVAAHPDLIWINAGGVQKQESVSQKVLANAEKPVPLLPGAQLVVDGQEMMVAHVDKHGVVGLVNMQEGNSKKMHKSELDLSTLKWSEFKYGFQAKLLKEVNDKLMIKVNGEWEPMSKDEQKLNSKY